MTGGGNPQSERRRESPDSKGRPGNRAAPFARLLCRVFGHRFQTEPGYVVIRKDSAPHCSLVCERVSCPRCQSRFLLPSVLVSCSSPDQAVQGPLIRSPMP